MPRAVRPSIRGAAAAGALLLCVTLAGCGADAGDSSSPYFATDRPSSTHGVGDIGGQVLAVIPAAARGPVSRPNLKLTPGAVAVRDVTKVCQSPRRTRDRIPYLEQKAIFTEYGIPYPKDARKYGLDYLVPVDLGGAPVAANIWPAAQKGIGFHEKQTLTTRLRRLVCQGSIPLETAQRQVVGDWYQLWLQYGAG